MVGRLFPLRLWKGPSQIRKMSVSCQIENLVVNENRGVPVVINLSYWNRAGTVGITQGLTPGMY